LAGTADRMVKEMTASNAYFWLGRRGRWSRRPRRPASLGSRLTSASREAPTRS
jgi:hypothetical protein